MKSIELTATSFPASIRPEGDRAMPGTTISDNGGRMTWQRALLALPVLGAMAMAGCVTVKAPDKPIVIELNINIKQEVVYRLSQDAGQTIDKNPGIF
ncbi:YnbE family lipoprotein [Novosphingobium lentum]|uniref:YnbE family lipoprotein n=1 Tax=Novosphingobium lentum TaxID=145287 RepID=UPI000A423AD5|nr:YnbE family lipoprotein [Novosphingobium lentum]